MTPVHKGKRYTCFLSFLKNVLSEGFAQCYSQHFIISSFLSQSLPYIFGWLFSVYVNVYCYNCIVVVGKNQVFFHTLCEVHCKQLCLFQYQNLRAILKTTDLNRCRKCGLLNMYTFERKVFANVIFL